MKPAITDQVIVSSLLDLIEGKREPQYAGPFLISNEITRTLAHLAVTDGNVSHLVRGQSGGALHVALRKADGTAQADTLPVSGTVAVSTIAGITPLFGGLGELCVGSFFGGVASTGLAGSASTSGEARLNLGSAASREVELVISGADAWNVFQGASAGATTTLLGVLVGARPMVFLTTLQHLTLQRVGGTAEATVGGRYYP